MAAAAVVSVTVFVTVVVTAFRMVSVNNINVKRTRAEQGSRTLRSAL